MDSRLWRCVIRALNNIILAQQLTICALKQELKDARRKP